MSNTFTSVTKTGIFSRMKNAIIGVLLGILMVPASIGLMGWNEYRTIHRTQGLAEGSRIVETVVDPTTINKGLDQKLVHLSGLADTDELLRDDEFQVEQAAIKLHRDVEMYQWVEKEDSETRTRTGGSKETTKTYTYRLEWAAGRVDSSKFQNKSAAENPTEHFSEFYQSAQNVKLGAYLLTAELVSAINAFQPISWTTDHVANLSPELQAQVKIEDEYLYWSDDATQGSNAPSVGDQRIVIRYVPPTEVSFVSQQVGNSFTPYKVSNGEKIQALYVGKLSATEIFEKLHSSNVMWAWILRGLGFLLCGIGFTMILGPISVLTDVIPFLGSLTRGAVGFVSFLMAIGISALTISFAWIAVRPLIGIPMLLVGIGAMVFIYRFASKNRKTSNGSGSADFPQPVYDRVEIVE